MGVTGIIVIIVVCAIATFFLYGIWAVENDNDNFRKKHGVKPKYYSCVTQGDEYCSHTDWCDAEIALYPEQYEFEMKRLENDKNQDK